MATESKNVLSQLLSDIWWLVLLRGILAVLLGIILLTDPGVALMIILIYIGVFWFIDGIFTVLASVKGRKHQADWGWGIFSGVISILAGLAVFSQPLMAAILTTTFLVYLVGFMVIVSGISAIVSGFRLRKTSNEWSMILGGVLAVLIGILLIFQPLMTTFTVMMFIGFLAMIAGISLIVFAFKVRKAGKTA